MPNINDPAYRYEYEQLADVCRCFIRAVEDNDGTLAELYLGALIGHCAKVYTMAPPAGLVDVPSMFVRREADES